MSKVELGKRRQGAFLRGSVALLAPRPDGLPAIIRNALLLPCVLSLRRDGVRLVPRVVRKHEWLVVRAPRGLRHYAPENAGLAADATLRVAHAQPLDIELLEGIFQLQLLFCDSSSVSTRGIIIRAFPTVKRIQIRQVYRCRRRRLRQQQAIRAARCQQSVVQRDFAACCSSVQLLAEFSHT